MVYMAKAEDVRLNLARNIKLLMDDRGWNQTELADRAGVSQKHVSNLLAMRKDPQLSRIEKIARAVGVRTWQLMMPELDKTLLHDRRVEQLLLDFSKATETGRDLITRIAEREAEYGRPAVLPVIEGNSYEH